MEGGGGGGWGWNEDSVAVHASPARTSALPQFDSHMLDGVPPSGSGDGSMK